MASARDLKAIQGILMGQAQPVEPKVLPPIRFCPSCGGAVKSVVSQTEDGDPLFLGAMVDDCMDVQGNLRTYVCTDTICGQEFYVVQAG